jgi:non-lysosomal glucosylceramidase
MGMSSQTTAADPTRQAPDIPVQAWRWPIGVGLADVGHSRVTRPMIDDGPWGGVPVGGLGSGSIGRTQGGEFARWHLGIGRHRVGPVAGCAFSVFTAPADDIGEGEAHVLSTLRPDALPGWRRDLPEGAGTYHALFPRAWLVYDWDALPVRLTQAQLSPVLPGDYRASSYPVGVFEWTVENPTDRPMRVGLMLSWQARRGRRGHPHRQRGPPATHRRARRCQPRRAR